MSFRIIDFNYAFDPSTTLSASSEDVQFPSQNMSAHFRSKVWRSAGHFLIDATNDEINFNEGGGNLLGTLSQGSYTTTTLAAEIKRVLDLAGADIYTVSYGAGTGKWTIASDGATFNITWLTDTGLGDAIGFDTSVNESGALTYTGSKVALHTDEYLQLDLGTFGGNPVDSMVLLFDTLVGSGLTSSAVVKLQANNTLSFVTPPIDETLSFDDTWQVYRHFFSSLQNYRFWRISIVDASNPNLYVELPKVVIGQNSAVTQSPELGFKDKLIDNSTEEQSIYGNAYYDVKPTILEREYAWKALNDSQKTELKKIFLRVGKIVPITIVLDEQEAVFADVDEHIIFGRLQDVLSVDQAFNTFFDSALVIREAL